MRKMNMSVAVALALLAAATAIAETRSVLTLDQLTSAAPESLGPVDNRWFLPTSSAQAALHRFSGTIEIPDHPMVSDPAQILPADIHGKRPQLFPGVALEFVSHDGHLVPLERDIIIARDSDSYWQIQVSPGRAWSEPGDDGMSRASFPFLLTSIIENESYNGVATFLYDDDSVSSLRYQVVSHLSPFVIQTRFTAAGQSAMKYAKHAGISEGVIADFDQELADRLVWRDWSELEEEYGAAVFADFDSGIDPSLTLTSGLVIDGEVYVRSMNTPFGPYPYPREMRHGVWSVTKTAAGMLTLMRMAEKYGDEILDERIADYLDVTAQHDGWKDVTFRHVFSMTTGVGTGTHDVNPNNIGVGDASNAANNAGLDDYMAWYFAPTLAEKLDEVFKIPSYPWGPGEHARYRDRDIFTGSAALEALLRERGGDDADLWQMMVEEVYRPIGIHHISMTHTREANERGTPMLAWGIYVSIDDIAKIAMLIQNGGVHDGVQLLSKQGIAEALYQTDRRGLPTGETNVHGPKSYHLTLWHENYVTESGKAFTAPRMSGYGGNIVQLMPNGIVGFRFGNGGDVELEKMTTIADMIRPYDQTDRRGRRRPGE